MNNKAIAYVRCSTDMQDASIPEQKKSIEEFAKKNDLVILQCFEDEGRSGRSAEDRPGFMEMKKLIENSNDFRFILVYDCTRFGRFKDPQEAVYWEVHFRKCGKLVKYATEESANDNTLGGRLVKTLKHEQATQYALDLSKTSFRGHKHYAELGFHVGGMAKYGYKRLLVDESGKPIRVLEYGEHKAVKTQHTKLIRGDPDEVKTIQRIFNMYVKENLGMTTITNILNKEGVPSPIRRPRAMSKGWSKSTIWSILHDPTYIGWIVYNKNAYDNLLEQDKEWGRTKPQEEWVINKSAHGPIVSEDLFKAVRSKARTSAAFYFQGLGRGQHSPYLLTGLIKCLNCGATYQGRTSAHYEKEKKAYKNSYYICGSYVMKGKHVCKSWCIPSEVLEKITINRLKKGNDSTRIKRVEERVKQKLEVIFNGRLGNNDDVEKELSIVLTQINNLTDAVAKGFDKDTATAKISELIAKRNRLKAMKTECQKAPLDTSQYTKRVATYIKEFEETFDGAAIAKKKAMVKKSLYKIEVDPNAKKCYFYIFKSPIVDESERAFLVQGELSPPTEKIGEGCLCSVQGQPSPPSLLKYI